LKTPPACPPSTTASSTPHRPARCWCSCTTTFGWTIISAGNRRRVPGQPGWAFVDAKFSWDERANLSGSVGHGKTPFGAVSHFGPAPADCELLDGVLLAARADALRQSGVRFDERFAFHFYDLDFCRSLRQQGLRIGTWPLAVTHQSGGAFGTPAWQQAHRSYQDKWPD